MVEPLGTEEKKKKEKTHARRKAENKKKTIESKWQQVDGRLHGLTMTTTATTMATKRKERQSEGKEDQHKANNKLTGNDDAEIQHGTQRQTVSNSCSITKGSTVSAATPKNNNWQQAVGTSRQACDSQTRRMQEQIEYLPAPQERLRAARTPLPSSTTPWTRRPERIIGSSRVHVFVRSQPRVPPSVAR